MPRMNRPAFRLCLLAALSCAASACTFVQMTPGADRVRVVEAAPQGCERRGEIEVSVTDSVAIYERNRLKVKDELEILARNEAPGIGADTVQPMAPPTDGAQRFVAWRCGR